MIDLYYRTMPNGHKITLFLEEAGLEYRIKPVSIGKGEQFEPAFLRISPNNCIPAIVDHAPADDGEPISLFESGAIILYLADKIGRFIPQDPRGRNLALQWLSWQIGGVVNMSVLGFAAIQQTGLGRILDRHWQGATLEGARIYAAAYHAAFLWLPLSALGAVLTLAMTRETYCRLWFDSQH